MSEMPEGLNSRDRVLWAGASLLGDGPGASLSVRAVAAKAGVSVGSLRHHFPTQRELINAVMKLVYDFSLRTGDLDGTAAPARDRVMAYLHTILAPTDNFDAAEAWRQTFTRYVETPLSPETREEYLAVEREIARRIEHLLTRLEDEGALPPGDNLRRATFLVTVVTGISIAQALPSEPTRPLDDAETLRIAVDWVFDGTTTAGNTSARTE
ncbi:hypothetical protein GCM10009718_11580 [Isoptericola halotolerans]|uniref:TetR family transcriptional regulator n=2 Tax=Isoptericola halotolerans TaxID=300560 RepID=UPI0014948D12